MIFLLGEIGYHGPGTVTWPTVAPSNTHLHLHLGLVVPSNANMRVANETRSVVYAASLPSNAYS